MVECPVCHDTFANEFALQGHIRLKRDSEHMTFKRKQSEKPSQETIKTAIIQPIGNNTRAVLENLLKEKERLLIQDANDEKFLLKLEDLMIKEREADEKEVEKNYSRGWYDRDKQCQKEINENSTKVKNEATRQCQEEINVACAKLRNESAQQCQYSINAAYKQGLDEGSFYMVCADCNREILILPGSPYYQYISDLLRWMGVICPECSGGRGFSPHFHSLTYFTMSNRISQLEWELFYRDIAEMRRQDEERRRQERRDIEAMKAKIAQERKKRL